MLIKIPRGWELPEREVTPQATYLNRRQLLAGLGLAGIGGTLIANAAALKQNTEFNTGDRPVTDEWAATGYNNYYEFDPENKERVKDLVGKFVVSPWSVKVSGLVNKPQTFDLDKLTASVSLEERIYRFRCVEAWAMTVPWTGFPMSALIKMVEPKPEAKYIKFWSVVRPDEMPGVTLQSIWTDIPPLTGSILDIHYFGAEHGAHKQPTESLLRPDIGTRPGSKDPP